MPLNHKKKTQQKKNTRYRSNPTPLLSVSVAAEGEPTTCVVRAGATHAAPTPAVRPMVDGARTAPGGLEILADVKLEARSDLRIARAAGVEGEDFNFLWSDLGEE